MADASVTLVHKRYLPPWFDASSQVRLLTMWVRAESERTLGGHQFMNTEVEQILKKSWPDMTAEDHLQLWNRLKWFRAGLLRNLLDLPYVVMEGTITLHELGEVRDCWKWNGMKMVDHEAKFKQEGSDATDSASCTPASSSADVKTMLPLILVANMYTSGYCSPRPFWFLLEGYHRARALIARSDLDVEHTRVRVIVMLVAGLERWERWNWAMWSAQT